jgi:pyruvate kinase
VKAVRNWAHDNNTYVGILMDLQGPKIRVAGFKDEKKIERILSKTPGLSVAGPSVANILVLLSKNYSAARSSRDLQGPKIRVAGFKDEKKIELNIGDKFALDADMDETSGNQDGVGIAYKTINHRHED